MAKQNQDENLITLVDEQGNETLYQELFNFHSDDYDKSYILLIPAGSEPEMPPSCRPCIRRRFRPWQEVYILTGDRQTP